MAVLPLGKDHTVSIEQEAGWAPDLVWTFWRKNDLFPLPGIKSNQDSLIIQPKAQSLHLLSYTNHQPILTYSKEQRPS